MKIAKYYSEWEEDMMLSCKGEFCLDYFTILEAGKMLNFKHYLLPTTDYFEV